MENNLEFSGDGDIDHVEPHLQRNFGAIVAHIGTIGIDFSSAEKNFPWHALWQAFPKDFLFWQVMCAVRSNLGVLELTHPCFKLEIRLKPAGQMDESAVRKIIFHIKKLLDRQRPKVSAGWGDVWKTSR